MDKTKEPDELPALADSIPRRLRPLCGCHGKAEYEDMVIAGEYSDKNSGKLMISVLSLK